MTHTDNTVDERFDDFLANYSRMETELKEWKDKYIGLEKSLNQTITMTNQLITNVNASNQFIAELHNALADAGLVKKPEDIIRDIEKDNIPAGAKKLMEENVSMEIKEEPDMEEVN